MIKLNAFTAPALLPQYPNRPGVYAIVGEDDEILYVGSSKQLCRRVSHLGALQHDATNDAGYSHIKAGLLREYQEEGHKAYIRVWEGDDYRAVEKLLIREHKPRWNKR